MGMVSSALLIAVVGAGCVSMDKNLDSFEQASTAHAPTVVGLAPVGYWRLGELSGTTAADSSGFGFNGTYVNGALLGRAGAIVNGGDTSAQFEERSGNYVNVPDHREHSLTQGWDNWNRIVPRGTSWGTSSGGDAWTAQVSTSNYYGVNGETAYVDPGGASGTWQQGLANITRLDGDTQVRVQWGTHATGGALQPVTLVVRRVDANNFLRAELRENTDRTLTLSLIKTENGASTTLAQKNVGTYNLNDWWYVRFQFSGGLIRAKAWVMDMLHKREPTDAGGCMNECPISYQPTAWDVTARDPSPVAGGVAIRTANSGGTARPIIRFEGYWVQTLGLTFQFWFSPRDPGFTGEGAPLNHSEVFGKGLAAGDQEYEMRWFSSLSTADQGVWKMYGFNLEGGLGAGVRYPAVDSGSPPIVPNQWKHFVVVFDSGDYLDTTAGISLYVDGQLYTPAGFCLGNLYSGLCNEGPNRELIPWPLYAMNPLWQITPRSGRSPVRIGQKDGTSTFSGRLDDVAIFPRKLSAAEIANLYTTGVSP